MAENDIDNSAVAAEQVKEARKLRELFKGRFSDEESLELLKEHGTLNEAVDFVLNGEPADVRKFINDRNEALVDSLRRESCYVSTALQQGLESSVRLFACQPCDRYWWRKVPSRKEVSRCRVCKQKYDPVPKEEEWGLGEFVCVCDNVFLGKAWMSHTKSPCYKCGFHASPVQILPPTKRSGPRPRKSGYRHSCDGRNCYNRAQDTPSFGHSECKTGGGGGGGGGGERLFRTSRAGGAGGSDGGGGDKDAPLCTHEQSERSRKVLYASQEHVSTGSTVNTFLTQGDLAEDYEDLDHMPSVIELDED
ncbi:shiftless antiviral inhibitor of ribosomal frameshifting protein homolog isoform X1 [Babylonia areolata]|uniref:shiftless antiviral inhibitor of ribosomal frameshifting protein homolog isoform X1 n=1 Tax=Babylonia areolata TaxID=304850 RepID=UPI003FD61B21